MTQPPPSARALDVPVCIIILCVSQESEKTRREQEAVLQDLRTKWEEERGAHAREIERLEVSCCRLEVKGKGQGCHPPHLMLEQKL